MTKHRADRGDLIVATIADFHAEYGYGPTVRELQDRVGLASPSAVHHHLSKLNREGRVAWTPGLTRTLVALPPAPKSGICARPGCGKPATKQARGPEPRWCGRSCAAIAAHLRRWLRSVNAEDVAVRIGLPL